MQMLLGAGSAGYTLQRSLRFRASASAYLNRTPASAGNQQKWTYSFWIKKAVNSGNTQVLSSYVSVIDYAILGFASNSFAYGDDYFSFNSHSCIEFYFQFEVFLPRFQSKAIFQSIFKQLQVNPVPLRVPFAVRL
jgi:hypothetical protein